MNHLEVLEKMRNSALENYILPGLKSHLLGGKNYGTIRMFEATRTQDEFITPHSHRYDFACLVLQGQVTNTLYVPSANLSTDEFMCTTLIKQDSGFVRVSCEEARFDRRQSTYETGEWYAMSSGQIHSIRFKKGSLVLFFEGEQVGNSSVILEPVVKGEHLQTFNVAPWMYKKES